MALAALLLAACGDDPDTVPLPTHGSSLAMKAQISGKVAGDAATGCVWLDLSNGTRHAVLWPRDHRARFDPVRVYDARDRLVLREGTERYLGGGWSANGVERLPAACRTGDRAWHLSSIGAER